MHKGSSISEDHEDGVSICPSKAAGDRVSAIIPTKDRAVDLTITVRSLLEQTSPIHELIIVDQSADEEGWRLVHDILRNTPEDRRKEMKMSYIRDPQISGGAAARNRAMQMAGGEIWLFLDDDVDLEPDFLDQILRVYRSHPEVAGVSGIITNYTRPARGSRLWMKVFARGPFFDERQPIYWRCEQLRQGGPIPVRRFGGGLMSFRANCISGLNFDENLRGVCDGEDVDFCAKLAPDNGRLMIAPRARLVHKQSPIGRLQDHWVRRHARANVFLFEKHWNRRLLDRVCFLWLLAGYVTAVTFGSLHRVSLQPWRSLLRGISEGRQAART